MVPGTLNSVPVTTDPTWTLATKLAINGGAFVNSYDTALWIAPATRTNPIINHQGLYVQARVSGDLGGFVHDAGASELRLRDATNGGTGQNAFEASLVLSGGVNDIASANGILANFHTENSPTGSFTSVALMRSSTIPALAAGFSIGTVYGLYVEPQTVGGANYSVYAPTGDSVFGKLVPKDVNSQALIVKGLSGQVADVMQFQNDAGTVFFRALNNGTAGVGGAVGSASFWVNNSLASDAAIALRVRAKSTQTGDLLLVEDSSTTLLANIDSTGAIRSTVALGTKHVAAATPTGGSSGDIKVGNSKIWVNDAGTWKSVAVA